MSENPDLYRLFEKLGGITTGLQTLVAQVSKMETEQERRHEENVKTMADTLEKVRDFKHQQAGHDQKVEGRLTQLEQGVKNLRKPVDEIIAIRSKIGIFLAAILSFGGAVWFFLQPIWNSVYQNIISRFLDGGHH